jgi:UDP-N-acetylglucosamine 2-epimerase (non-hydrolysing)
LKKVSFIFGTRPEAIKLCPLILAMQKESFFEPHVCITGQHKQMLDQVLEVFNVRPDADLALMQPNQTLAAFTSKAIIAINQYLLEYKPDLILVQGDTTSVFCASLAAFYNRIPVGHVEAGLRTWNKFSPYPEEINRVLTTHIADYHFAPTKQSRENLIKEGIDSDKIYTTGNTVIDALYIAVNKVKENPPEIPGLAKDLINSLSAKSMVLITGHRRENFGDGFDSICKAISALASKFKNAEFIYPVHLNPNVREPVFRLLSNLPNVHLIEPLSYLPFVSLMEKAKIILTDSGGVQEEAPSLGKPVLVMRDTTERPEAVDAGTVKLVGTDTDMIVENVSMLLTDKKEYGKMAKAINPYGDGKATGRILAACKQLLAGK